MKIITLDEFREASQEPLSAVRNVMEFLIDERLAVAVESGHPDSALVWIVPMMKKRDTDHHRISMNAIVYGPFFSEPEAFSMPRNGGSVWRIGPIELGELRAHVARI